MTNPQRGTTKMKNYIASTVTLCLIAVTLSLAGCIEKENAYNDLSTIPISVAQAAPKQGHDSFLIEIAQRMGKTINEEQLTETPMNLANNISTFSGATVVITFQKHRDYLLSVSDSELGSRLHQDLQNGNVGEPLSQSEFESRAVEFFERVFRKVPDDKWQLDPTTVDNPESIKQGMKTLRWYYYANGYRVQSGMTCYVVMRADTGEVISAFFHDLHPIEDPVINYSQEYARNFAIQELKKRYSVVNETAPVRTNYRALRREPDEPYKPLILCHTVSLKTDTHMVYDVDISARTGEVIEKLGFKVLPNR